MNIQRFQAPNLRDALAKARKAFGEGTLILSNRATPHGVEVVATTEDALADLNPPAAAASPAKAQRAQPAGAPARAAEPSAVDQDTEQLAMSTLSFQEYVRERMMNKRHERAAQVAVPQRGRVAVVQDEPPPARERRREVDIEDTPTLSAQASPQKIFEQLNAMQAMIEERLGAMAWLGQARQQPIQANMLLKLVRAGYSPELARKLLDALPSGASPADAVRQIIEAIAAGIQTDEGRTSIVDEGGVFAVLGTTGVGKTTTVSKLVGRCLKTYGANSVGLITLDTHRAGAHEQLRASARSLGVVAHLAHDQPALKELLSLLAGKKMVLVDTAGLAPRDARVRDAVELTRLPGVKHLLALNAVSHGEATDSTIQAYRTTQLAGALICKVDEAVKLGPILDTAIRHKLVLRGVCTGQRIAEDLLPANAADLVRLSMRSSGKSAFDPGADDLALYFSGAQHDAKPTTLAAAR